MIATAIPVGAIRHPATARALPPGFVPTVRRTASSFGNPWAALLELGVGVVSGIMAQKATLAGLQKTLAAKKKALADARTQAKRLTLQAQIAVLEDKIARLEDQIAAEEAMQAAQGGSGQAGTPIWQYAAGGLAAVVIVGGLGYLVLGGRGRSPRRNPRRRSSRR